MDITLGSSKVRIELGELVIYKGIGRAERDPSLGLESQAEGVLFQGLRSSGQQEKDSNCSRCHQKWWVWRTNYRFSATSAPQFSANNFHGPNLIRNQYNMKSRKWSLHGLEPFQTAEQERVGRYLRVKWQMICTFISGDQLSCF